MADQVDIAALTEDQQLALQQFTAVTDQDLKDAVPLLQRCQWNVQIAIARFFDGEPAEDPVAAAAAQPAPQDARRQETLMTGFGSPRSSTSSARRVRVEPAPRVVPQPESQVNAQAPLVLSLLWAPVSLLYSLLARYFRFVGYLFPFIPRAWGRITASNVRNPPSRRSAGRRPLNPRDTAARFVREFEEEYGANTLPFHDGGYASAFDLAKKDLKFLLVVLVSPEHDLTASFVRDTLLDPSVVSFLRDPSNNMLLWAGSVSDSEAYSVSSALNCTKFPFSGLIVHTPSVSSSAMGIAARIAGPTPPAAYIAKLKAAMATHADALTRVRAQRAEQNATRTIRSQQDSAYERSLALDRERARQKKLAAEQAAAAEKAALEAEQAAARHTQNLAQWRRWRASTLPPEPPATDKSTVRISLRMPNADRIVRSFAATATIEDLYAFVECYDTLQEQADSSSTDGVQPPPKDFVHAYAFQLVSPMPRKVYALAEGGALGERVGRSANLIVERVGGELDSDDDDGGE
ncbi:UBX domain-containing protein 10 [Ascochyta clinopodiicola]|nr:UBX domain-containing protein 10 [Ascochyta clinopodiicola]